MFICHYKRTHLKLKNDTCTTQSFTLLALAQMINGSIWNPVETVNKTTNRYLLMYAIAVK